MTTTKKAVSKGLTFEKAAFHRITAFNVGVESYLSSQVQNGHIKQSEANDLRNVIAQACAGAQDVTRAFASGDEKTIRRIKTAFANAGIPLTTGDEMSTRKEQIVTAIKGGLTSEKVAQIRQAAEEIGIETYIEKAGFDEESAEKFRAIIYDGIQAAAASGQQA